MIKYDCICSIGSPSERSTHVVMTFDNGWSPYAGATIVSALDSASGPIMFHIATTSISEENLTKLKRLFSKSDHCLEILAVDPAAMNSFLALGWWSNATFLRLGIADILEVNRVIYLDADLIVRDDLSVLFGYDLRDAMVAGVPEFPDRLLHSSTNLNWLCLPPSDSYINTGVMLMDLRRLRSERFFLAALDWYRLHGEKVRLADQCVLNAVLIGEKRRLHPRWNVRQLAVPPAKFESMFVSGLRGVFHFNGASKPWTQGANKAVFEEWSRYAERAGYDAASCLRPAPPLSEPFQQRLLEIEEAAAEAIRALPSKERMQDSQT